MAKRTVVSLLIKGKDLSKRAFKGVDRKLGRMKKALFSINGLLASLGVSLAATGIARWLTATNVQFQKLNAQLHTVTGSAENARKAFKGIEDLASSTPFQIENLAEAFVTLKTAGITPTREILTAFGDTAASFSKDITEYAEAVRSATTGEMERLKQFGIVARQAGDEVTFSFQGQKTTVKRTSEDIVGYLQSIAENNFAGAMEREMDTLGGTFSNLKDNLGTLARAIGEAGLTEALTKVVGKVRDLTAAVVENRVEVARTVGKVVGWVKVALTTVFTLGRTVARTVTIAFNGVFLIVAETVASLSDIVNQAIGDLNTLIRKTNAALGTNFGTLSRVAWGDDFAQWSKDLAKENEDLALGIQEDLHGVADAWRNVGREAEVAAAKARAAQRVEADLAAGTAPKDPTTGRSVSTPGAGASPTLSTAPIKASMPVGTLTMSEAEYWAASLERALDAATNFDDLMTRITDRTLNNFGNAIRTSFKMMAEGSEGAGEAFQGAMLGALSAVAQGFGEFYLAKATAAIGEGLSGNPAAFAAAAKYTAAATALFALSGALAGSAPGGGGGSSSSASDRTNDVASEKGEATVYLEGDFFLNSTDPKSVDRFAKMMESVSGRRVTVKRSGA